MSQIIDFADNKHIIIHDKCCVFSATDEDLEFVTQPFFFDEKLKIYSVKCPHCGKIAYISNVNSNRILELTDNPLNGLINERFKIRTNIIGLNKVDELYDYTSDNNDLLSIEDFINDEFDTEDGCYEAYFTDGHQIFGVDVSSLYFDKFYKVLERCKALFPKDTELQVCLIDYAEDK